jgi:hypothetical protein
MVTTLTEEKEEDYSWMSRMSRHRRQRGRALVEKNLAAMAMGTAWRGIGHG